MPGEAAPVPAGGGVEERPGAPVINGNNADTLQKASKQVTKPVTRGRILYLESVLAALCKVHAKEFTPLELSPHNARFRTGFEMKSKIFYTVCYPNENVHPRGKLLLHDTFYETYSFHRWYDIWRESTNECLEEGKSSSILSLNGI